jgi:UPF0755 protein
VKKLFLGIFIVLALLILGIGTWWYWYKEVFTNPLPQKHFVNILISKDEPASTVIQVLQEKGLIRSSLAVKIYLRVSNLAGKLKPGSYEISASNTPAETIRQLTLGPKDVKITFPEGWRREQFAVLLNSTLPNFDTDTFLALSASEEGYLFPDTYYVPADITPQKILARLTTNFAAKTHLSIDKSSDHDVVILASLVEREAKNDTDRPIVAGILLNRLKEQWPLQVDATVQYAKDTIFCNSKPLDCRYWQPIYDTKIPSTFNTYLHLGLPPHAIANPGLASIQAVLNPVVTTYMYYLTDTQGANHYAKSLPEHNRNVDKYLKP